ncbi:MAG: MATE family efflux transporter [Lachnospira sp.]|nr:MATE family efflux transporter [Lachnospira sp.]
MKKNNSQLILNGSLLKALFTLAIPIVLNSFIQTMYNLTDSYWLGKLGEANQAAITMVSPIQNIIVSFGTGITVAGAVLIAQYIGANEINEAKKMATHILVCALAFAIICSALCFISTPFIVEWLGGASEVKKLGITYLRIVVLDIPFLFMINIYIAINQAQGNTLKPMLVNLSGVIINMILDPLLMFGFNLGISGAALATLFSKVPCAIIAAIALFNKNNFIKISLKGFRFEKSKVKSIISVGLPTAIGGSTMQFGFLLMSKNVVKYGTVATAAYGIGNRVNGLISLPSNAMGSAVGTIVAQNIGANQYERAEKAYKLSRNISVMFLFIGGLILSNLKVSAAIVSIFSDNPEVVSFAADFLMVMAICSWTNGVHNSTNGLFNGSGHTMITMVIDASRMWVFRFLTLYICENIFHMYLSSIWYSVVVSNAISALILWILYKTGIWKKRVIKIDKQSEKNA